VLVLIPGIGLELNGARRWLSFFGVQFQPVEIMKIAYIIFLASWFHAIKDGVKDLKRGLFAFLLISAIPAILLIFQPDIDNALIMLGTGFLMYFISGAKKKHIIVTLILLVGVFGIVAMTSPYIKSRISTYFNPEIDPLSSSYQVRQSLIAVGSGEIMGKGFGKSIQKFQHLPEPTSDSIFAVAAEEFGFIGSSIIVLLYVLYFIFGMRIAFQAKHLFGRLTVFGIVILIVSQSFLNIASMLGIFPLSGLPLLFISKGGTALFMTLFATGIVLNISKYKNQI
jgi:cell division protein FtsW